MSTTIEVNPLEIKKSVKPGQQYEETLTVHNISDERYSYHVRPAEAYRAWVDPDPNLFAINAHEAREITLELRPPGGARPGLHNFKIEVVNEARSDDTTEVDVTLKVPVPWYWWVIIAIVIILLLALIVYLGQLKLPTNDSEGLIRQGIASLT
jgi:hypothetical protein